MDQHGIQPGDIKKLVEAGIHTIEAVLFKPKKDLVLVKGLSEAKVDKILEAAMRLCDQGFQTASKFLETRKDTVYLTTGSKSLDSLLGG